MDFLDPVQSIYTVPLRIIRRVSLMVLGMSVAYVCGVGPSVIVSDSLAIPMSAITCIWHGPVSDLAILSVFVAFLYAVFSEKSIRFAAVPLMILVYCHCAHLSWYVWALGSAVAAGVTLYFLYRAVRRFYAERNGQ